MNIDLYEILGELNEKEGLLINNPFLGAASLLSKEDILKRKIPVINSKSSVYIDGIRGTNDLLIGQKFDVIFAKTDPKNYVKAETITEWMSIYVGQSGTAVIPRGQGGIIKLTFPKGIPKIIQMLRPSMNQPFNKDKDTYLFFTVQKVMDRIIEEIEKLENPAI